MRRASSGVSSSSVIAYYPAIGDWGLGIGSCRYPILSPQSLTPNPSLPQRIQRRQVYPIIGRQIARHPAPKALLEAKHAIQRVALGLLLQSRARFGVGGTRGQAKLVWHAPEIVQPAAARAGPLDRMPLQRVVRAALQPCLGRAAVQVQARAGPGEDHAGGQSRA